MRDDIAYSFISTVRLNLVYLSFNSSGNGPAELSNLPLTNKSIFLFTIDIIPVVAF